MAPREIPADRTSEQENGHIVDNGEEVEEEFTPRQFWKKLSFIQDKVLDLEDRLEKIERNTRPQGGSQPRGKFTTDVLHTEKAGQKVLSDLGKEIKQTVDGQGELDKNDFKKLMREHGWTASAERTYRHWMEKISDHFDAFRYEPGEAGGTNRPSRIVWRGYDD
ncbi:MAG: hypothetical protein ABEJ72_00255 [Candidatus Aenigmatarchaeota archaeon]